MSFVFLILSLASCLVWGKVPGARTPGVLITKENLSPLGWDNGNAGDAYASEFILSGRDLVQRIELLTDRGAPIYDTTNLRAAVQTTEVVSEEHVSLDGYERDAVNFYPNKRLIKLNRTRWRDLRKSTETKIRLRLVLHEYLWISGVDDTNYTHSDPLIEQLNISNYSPSIWWNPVNPVNFVRLGLSYSPNGCIFESAKFNLKNSNETLDLVPTGNCGPEYRRVQIVKSTGITPPSSNVRGFFHMFQISIFDKDNVLKGEMNFEPEWGACLVPENESCRASGKMSIGGVELIFMYLRE